MILVLVQLYDDFFHCDVLPLSVLRFGRLNRFLYATWHTRGWHHKYYLGSAVTSMSNDSVNSWTGVHIALAFCVTLTGQRKICRTETRIQSTSEQVLATYVITHNDPETVGYSKHKIQWHPCSVESLLTTGTKVTCVDKNGTEIQQRSWEVVSTVYSLCAVLLSKRNESATLKT